jgi:hypothetical protein
MKKLNTKAYGGDKPFIVKSIQGVWMTASDLSAEAQGIDGSMKAVVSGAANYNGDPRGVYNTVPNYTYTLTPNPYFASPSPYFSTWGAGSVANGAFAFTNISVNFASNSSDFVIGNLVLGYRDEMAIF